MLVKPDLKGEIPLETLVAITRIITFSNATKGKIYWQIYQKIFPRKLESRICQQISDYLTNCPKNNHLRLLCVQIFPKGEKYYTFIDERSYSFHPIFH